MLLYLIRHIISTGGVIKRPIYHELVPILARIRDGWHKLLCIKVLASKATSRH